MTDRNEQSLSSCIFVGETLGPLFLNDPSDNAVRPLYDAFAELDVADAAASWPFVCEDESKDALRLMAEGAHPDKREALVWEYRRLFAEPGPKIVPPWGSVYTDRECVIFGATTLALRAWMREHGVKSAAGDTQPDDHIGLMLIQMAWLAEHQPEALDEYLADHLLTWAPHFLEEVEQASNHPFFEGLACLARLTLEGIRQERSLSVVTPRFYR